MPKDLAANLDLLHEELQAAALLEAFQSAHTTAIDRVRQHLPQVQHLKSHEVPAFSLSLSDAQTVIAREYGMKSWGELRLAIKLKKAEYGDVLDQFKQLVHSRDAAGSIPCCRLIPNCARRLTIHISISDRPL